MSIHKPSNTEINDAIQGYMRRIESEKTKIKWSVAMIAVGIILGIIGWANYETSSWGILALVGVVIGLVGVGEYVSTRHRITQCHIEIVTLVAILEDRRRSN